MPNQTMQGLAGILAEQGRYGDTMLMHVAPSEVKYLANLGGITENPMTGLPEAFKFKDLLPFVGSAFLGPAFKAVGFSPGVSSFLASTASTMIGGGSLEKGIMSGLVSSSVGRLGRNLAATSPDAAVDAATGQPIADTGYKFGIFKKPETGTFGSRYSEAFQSPEFNPIEMAKVATEGGLDNFMEQIQKPGVLLPLTTGLGELARINAEEDYIRQYQNFLTSQTQRRKQLQTKYPQIVPSSNPYYRPGMAEGGIVQRKFDGDLISFDQFNDQGSEEWFLWSDGTYNRLPEETGVRTPYDQLPDTYKAADTRSQQAAVPADRPLPDEPIYNPPVTPVDSQPAPVDVSSFFVPGAEIPESTGFNDQALYELAALLSQPKVGGQVDVARNFAIGPISVDPNVSATVYKPIGQPTVEAPPQQTLADYGLTQAEADAIAANMKPLYSGVDTAAMEANFLAGLSPEELKGVEQMNEYSSFLKNRFDDIRQALAAKNFEKAFDLAISGDKQYIEKFNPGEMTQGIFTANMMRTSDISQMAGPMTEDDIRAYYEAMPVDKVIPLLYPGAKVGDYIYTIDKNAAMQKDIAALKASGGVGYPTAADQVGMKSTKQNLTIPLITVALAFAGVPFALGDAVASSSIGAKLGLAGLGKAGTTALGSAIIGASGSALQGGSFEDALKAGLIAGGLSFIAETALGGIKDAYNNWALDNLPLGEQVNNTLVTVADPNTVIVSAVNQANSIAQATTQAAAQVAAQQATQPEVKVTTGKETVQPSAPVPTTVTPPAEPLVQTPLDQVTVRTGPETVQQPNAPVVVTPPPAPEQPVVQTPLDQVTVRTGPETTQQPNVPVVTTPPPAPPADVVQPPLDQVTVRTGPQTDQQVNVPVVAVPPPATPVIETPLDEVVVTSPRTPVQEVDVPVLNLDVVDSDIDLTSDMFPTEAEVVIRGSKPGEPDLNVPTPNIPTTTPFVPPTAPTPINTPGLLDTLKEKGQEILTDAAIAQLLSALAGGTAGGAGAGVGGGGGYTGTGGLGYIPEGQERKYFGAPGDYRHGFLPEWMFFTNLNPPAVIDTTQPGTTPGGSPGTRPGTTPDDRIEPKAVGGTIKSYSPRGYLEMIQGYNEGGEIEETMMEDSDAPMTDGSRQLIPLTQAAILGQLPEDQTDDVIQKFIDLHGNRAFRKLREETLESVANGSRKEGMVEGHTGGMDDMVDGVIGSSERVAVSPGEFIIPADVVSMLGDGNSDSGRHKLEQMMSRVRKDKTGSTKQARPINSAKVLPA